MKILFVLAILVVISAAQFDWIYQVLAIKSVVLDNIHNYRFEEHITKSQKLLVVISDKKNEKKCHVIEIDDDLHDLLQDQDYIYMLTEDIYHLIHDNKQNEELSSSRRLANKYIDVKLRKACAYHTTYLMTYTPTFSYNPPTPSMSTTQ